MKKIIVTILTIAYLGTSTGAVVNMHYCMGKLANWGLGNGDSKTCGKCGMEKQNKGSCCRDEHKFFKNFSDQKITKSAFSQVQLLVAALPVTFVEIIRIGLPGIIRESPTGHDPPLHQGISIYIFTCDYRI